VFSREKVLPSSCSKNVFSAAVVVAFCLFCVLLCFLEKKYSPAAAQKTCFQLNPSSGSKDQCFFFFPVKQQQSETDHHGIILQFLLLCCCTVLYGRRRET
jgi:hypothetical protein